MSSKITTTVFAVAMAVFPFSPVHSATNVIETPQEVERWFVALGGVDRREFRNLIADNALINLKDLGVTQTKNEFIASLDEWAAATKEASVVYRYQAISDDNAVVQVCYRFKYNETLSVEKFTFSNEKITSSVQEKMGNNCGDM